MSDERRLLAAICAAPEDDGPRLAYADWLLQRGDPRGEFIQAQCSDGNPARADALLAAHGAAWVAGLPAPLTLTDVTFARGFPCRIVLPTLDFFFTHAAALCAFLPRPRFTAGDLALRLDRAGRRCVVCSEWQTSTESGRNTYFNGGWTLRVYDVDTRALAGELSGRWYGDDSGDNGLLTDWWIEPDDRTVVAVLDRKERRTLLIA